MEFDKIDLVKGREDPTTVMFQTTGTGTTTASSSSTGVPVDERWDSFEALRHQEHSPMSITTILFKLCDPKINCSEDSLAKLSNIVVEKLICESPLTEILRTLDSNEFGKNTIYQFDYKRFLIFCRYLCSSDKQGYDIIAMTFFGRVWKHNASFQYEFIKYCINSDWVQEILNSCTIGSLTKKVPQIELLKCPHEYDTDPQIYCWKYQCLSQILLQLSENATSILVNKLEEMFFFPLNKCPDLLVFALLECHGNYSLRDLVLTKALLNFICVPANNPHPNPNATLIIQRIWPSDFIYTPKVVLSTAQKALLRAMVELYTSSSQEEQASKLSKILDLSQDLKVLNLLLSSNTYSFVIDLACFASRREYLKLDKWLNDKIQQIGQPFVEACIAFLQRRCNVFGATEPATLSLPNETYRTIITCLFQHISDSPKSLVEMEISKMFKHFNTTNQMLSQNQFVNNPLQMSNMMPPVKASNQFDSVGSQPPYSEIPIHSPQLNSQQMIHQQQQQQQHQSQPAPTPHEEEEKFSKEIEEEADSYFQRIYNQDQPDALTIDQFLNMLKRFSESPQEREKKVAACMIRNLFKEYPFLAQYPDKELVITGEIFGGIIMNNFVKGFSMVHALRLVLEALKKGPLAPRYFTFGQAALNKLKPRLKEFPQFCHHLCNLQSYRELSPELIEYIEYGKISTDPRSVISKKAVNFVKMSTINSDEAAATPSVAPVVTEIVEITPPNAFQDKVAFIVNNLSQMNLAKKADEFKELFHRERDQYLHWFSHYFVMKRVCLESNFHELYATFINKVNIIDLMQKILSETYRNIKMLLRGNKENDNFNDRTLLKNLGQWLGMITLAQNKPVLTRHLDLRGLLIEAYHKGLPQLLYVVPFVAKVLAGSARSKVFRPPCPWTVRLIRILVELHSEPDLKLSLKFEVEVLCKNLNIEIEEHRGKTHELQNKELLLKLEPQLGGGTGMENCSGNAAINAMDSVNIQSSCHLMQQGGMLNSSVPPVVAPATQQAIAPVAPINYAEMNVPNLQASLVVQHNLQIVMIYPNHKNAIKALMEKCVQDWIQFISDRVIKVCLTTSETLVKKDFAHEPDAETVRGAAHKITRFLVGGYSLINTEEPLYTRLQAALCNYFQNCKPQLNISKELIESTITTLINDNIELCVCYVQKVCTERALEELDKRMKPDFEARQCQVKKGPGVSLKNMQIYEEMGRNVAGYHSGGGASSNYSAYPPLVMENNWKGNNAVNAGAQTGGVVPSGNNYGNVLPPNDSVMNQQQVPMNSMVDSFALIYDKLIKHLMELIQEFEYIRYNTDAILQVLEALKAAKQNPRDQATAAALIKNVINGLRELMIIDSGTADFSVVTRVRDFYLLLLKALTDQRAFNHRFTTTQVTRSLIENWNATSATFPDEAFNTLHQSELINFSYMDSEFHQSLESGANTIPINLILTFLKCYIANINANNFANTLELLQRISLKVNHQSINHPLIADLKAILSLARCNVVPASELDLGSLQDRFHAIIKEWINLYNSPQQAPNHSFQTIVKTMSTQGLLKNDELISRFFKSFLETCVERCCQLMAAASQQAVPVPPNDVHLRCFECVDAFSGMVLMFIKQTGNQGNIEQKFQFLGRILDILANTAYKDQELRQKDLRQNSMINFVPLSYYRILLIIFLEFALYPYNLGIQDMFLSNDNLHDIFKFQLVRNYCRILHIISPVKIPSFTFAWLDFISHRVFIGKCLDNSIQFNYKSWNLYYGLLNDLLVFGKAIQNFDPCITNMELYKATFKIFLLLYHDFPEFLCEYCYNLCDTIPVRAVQLRNIILSASPSTMGDMSNVKVENLHEIVPPVRIPNNSLLEQITFLKELESYIQQRAPSSFPSQLCGHLNGGHFNGEKSPGLNVSLINALTLYLGLSFGQTAKTITPNSVGNSAHFDIFQNLLISFDSQGRYILINSIVDHLRYPNNETVFFICVLLVLFKENDDPIREQIVRVLLERIMAHRPTPWGVGYVVNELKRNPSYKLSEHNFIKCVPEIENYFSQSG